MRDTDSPKTKAAHEAALSFFFDISSKDRGIESKHHSRRKVHKTKQTSPVSNESNLISTMKIAQATALSLSLATASAFAPAAQQQARATSLAMSDEAVDAVVEPKKTIFGWAPEASEPCYGLPGAIEPLGFFDPLELTKEADLNTVKRYREGTYQQDCTFGGAGHL